MSMADRVPGSGTGRVLGSKDTRKSEHYTRHIYTASQIRHNVVYIPRAWEDVTYLEQTDLSFKGIVKLLEFNNGFFTGYFSQRGALHVLGRIAVLRT